MDELAKIFPPSISETKQLREFYDNCENNIRGLESLGVSPDTYGNLLIPILLKKLPTEFCCLLFRAHPKADGNLKELRTALREEIETREKGCKLKSPETSMETTLVPTIDALFTGVSNHQTTLGKRVDQRSKTCAYCNGNHPAIKCNKLKTLEERREFFNARNVVSTAYRN